MTEPRYEGPAKCAAAPCASCPYRKDVPSGVWDASEYAKLPGYDGEIFEQLLAGATGMFACHQQNGYLCAGWVATHDMDNTVALRLTREEIDPMIFDYKSPVPVFASGREAAEHGMARVAKPDREAKKVIDRLERKQRRRAR